MTTKQCVVYDIENELMHGAILLNTGDAICGCCGGILPADELNQTWKILKQYDYWVDLTAEIIGDDINE